MEGKKIKPMEGFFPTMPAPFSSSNAGEVWVWEDYVCLFQKEPQLFMDVALLSKSRAGSSQHPLSHEYAVTVFEKEEKNNVVLSVSIEWNSILLVRFLGLFMEEGRRNLGEIKEDMNEAVAKEKLFEIVGTQMGFSTDKRFAGTILELFPEEYKKCNH